MTQALAQSPVVTSERPERPRTAISRPDGRTGYTRERLDLIVGYIAKGMPPSRAAVLCGVSRQALSDWRSERPEVAEAIEQAEASHLADIAADLRTCRTKWGSPDPKALELELRRYREYAPHQTVESTQVNVSVQLGADQLAMLHGAHVARLKAVSESVTIPLELSDSGTQNPQA